MFLYMYFRLEPRPNSLPCVPQTAQYNSPGIQYVRLGRKDHVTITWNANFS